jgi:hypothetical protein
VYACRCLAHAFRPASRRVPQRGKRQLPTLDRDSSLRLFALVFGLSLAAVQIVFINAYFRWLGAGWPLAPILALVLVGVPAVVELHGDELATRFPLLTPLFAQARSRLWQVINAILVFAGALMGYGFAWWQAALTLAAILMAPRFAAELIRRYG